MRKVVAQRDVHSSWPQAAKTFALDPVFWLPRPCQRGAHRFITYLAVGPVSVLADCLITEACQGRSSVVRRVCMSPSSLLARSVADIDGDLILKPRDDAAVLQYVGAWRPPAPTRGIVFGYPLARVAVANFLVEVATHLGQRPPPSDAPPPEPSVPHVSVDHAHSSIEQRLNGRFPRPQHIALRSVQRVAPRDSTSWWA